MSGDLQVGSQLAGYRIDSLVGRGGMGVVYSAEQLRLGRMVALKVLAPELAANDAFRERFDRESRLAALIDHPNIVPIYEAGETDGLLFIAMRWVEGMDLGALLKREGPLHLERALHLLGQVASALDAAHEHGLVHRDVKPANVLVAHGSGPGSMEHAYLTDFGIAKMATGGPAGSVTRTGMFLGTADYASPEQFEGQELDGRADLYALGCLLFQCLTGSKPFERTQELAVMYAHLHDPPPSVTEVRNDLPPGLDDVVAKAMAKRREDRFATCGEMIEAARAARDGWAQATMAAAVPVVAPTVASSEQIAAAAPGSEAATAASPPLTPGPPPGHEALSVEAPPAGQAPPPATSREPRSRRGLWLSLVAAAVIGVPVAAVLVVTSGDDGDPGSAAATSQTEAAATDAAATDPPLTDAATTEAGSTEASETGGETAAPAEASALVWTPFESESLGGGGGQEIARMTVTGDDVVVAVGSEGPARGHDVAFWTADAGGRAAEKEVLAEGGDERAFGVAAAGDGGAVAVGYRQAEPPLGETDAGVWVLSDGQWEAVRDGLVEPGYEKMNRAAPEPGGQTVAVGTAGPGYSETGVPLPTDAAVWMSDDGGSTWARADAEGFVKDGYQEMRGITTYEDGLTAVGYDSKDAAVWRFDGASWREVGAQADLAVGDGRVELDMRDVVEWEGGLLAVGDVRTSGGDRNGAVWFSSDGEAWTLVEPAAFGGSGDQQILGVATGSFGIVAVGCSGCDGPAARPVVWTSADGETWTQAGEDQVAAVDTPQQMNAVTVASDSLVAGGWAEADAARDAAVWTANLAG